MSRSSLLKKERHQMLLGKIKEEPFLTDEEIAERLQVSVPTIGLTGLSLAFPNSGKESKALLRRTTARLSPLTAMK